VLKAVLAHYESALIIRDVINAGVIYFEIIL